MRPCAVCAAPASLTCGRCGAAWYCGAACQRSAWTAHKPVCTPPPPPLWRARLRDFVAFLEAQLEQTGGRVTSHRSPGSLLDELLAREEADSGAAFRAHCAGPGSDPLRLPPWCPRSLSALLAELKRKDLLEARVPLTGAIVAAASAASEWAAHIIAEAKRKAGNGPPMPPAVEAAMWPRTFGEAFLRRLPAAIAAQGEAAAVDGGSRSPPSPTSKDSKSSSSSDPAVPPASPMHPAASCAALAPHVLAFLAAATAAGVDAPATPVVQEAFLPSTSGARAGAPVLSKETHDSCGGTGITTPTWLRALLATTAAEPPSAGTTADTCEEDALPDSWVAAVSEDARRFYAAVTEDKKDSVTGCFTLPELDALGCEHPGIAEAAARLCGVPHEVNRAGAWGGAGLPPVTMLVFQWVGAQQSQQQDATGWRSLLAGSPRPLSLVLTLALGAVQSCSHTGHSHCKPSSCACRGAAALVFGDDAPALPLSAAGALAVSLPCTPPPRLQHAHDASSCTCVYLLLHALI